MAQKYKNIPVKPDTYAKVALISESNGLGERGLGAQIERWVERELPECGHKKQAVTIETFPNATSLVKSVIRNGWYCPICKRVYARLDEVTILASDQGDGKKLLDAVKVKG